MVGKIDERLKEMFANAKKNAGPHKPKELPRAHPTMIAMTQSYLHLVHYEPVHADGAQVIGTMEAWIPAMLKVRVNTITKPVSVEIVDHYTHGIPIPDGHPLAPKSPKKGQSESENDKS